MSNQKKQKKKGRLSKKMHSFFQFRMEGLPQEHSAIKAGYSRSYARKNASRIEKSIAYKELLRQQVDPFIVENRISQLIASPKLKTEILLKVYRAINSDTEEVHRLEELVLKLRTENRRLKEMHRLGEQNYREDNSTKRPIHTPRPTDTEEEYPQRRYR